jgi:hypothetical protein
MKIFISWSGTQSNKIAEAFRKWLPSVIQVARPYYSPDDISKGSKWESEISKELEASRIGIICLTPENLSAPWIMFEAGALSKQVAQSKVCPILFGVDPAEVQGPLVPFQAAKFSKEEIFRVLKAINNELDGAKLDSDVLARVFEMWWPQLNEEIEKIMSAAITSKKDKRTDRDMLEEILSLQRETIMTQNRVTNNKNSISDISPQAIEDLVEGYLQIAQNSLSLKGNLNALAICETLKILRMPISHIARKSSLDKKYISILKKADDIIEEIINETPLE